jgi:GTP-binding protein
MQFIDEAEIHAKAGDGGPGAVAFRREKFVPRGGPSGGDGGNGADIILETDERLTTLLDFRFKREYRGRNGEPGRGRDQNGHAAPELVLKIPPGTLVRDSASGEVLADLRDNGRRWVLAKGGRGGLGNMNFATPTLQAPRFAQPGTEGEEKRVRLELRLLADVGLVGFPNAGKSTLVSRLSRARPKIADYPFTTLQPHLGVVQYKDARSFVLSDLPGLIEGAHRGAGLGHRFLKHMARCRAVIHLVDASQDRDLVADYEAINRELELFDPALGRKAQIVAANKIDVPEARERAEAFAKKLKRKKIAVQLVSGATGEGLPALLDATVLALDRAPLPAPLERDTNPMGGELEANDAVAFVHEGKAELHAKERQAESFVDERAIDARAREDRAPPLTGRRKDGVFKATAAAREKRGKKGP